MAERPLTELQVRVLRAMAYLDGESRYPRAHTPNQIGYQAGAKRVEGSGRGNGRGSGHRVFGPAQQIIPTLTSLRKRGLIGLTSRPDGWSGTAYYLTDAGERSLYRRLDWWFDDSPTPSDGGPGAGPRPTQGPRSRGASHGDHAPGPGARRPSHPEGGRPGALDLPEREVRSTGWGAVLVLWTAIVLLVGFWVVVALMLRAVMP